MIARHAPRRPFPWRSLVVGASLGAVTGGFVGWLIFLS